MSLRGIARETVAISEGGTYVLPSGATVDIRAELLRAREGTRLYRPDDPVVAPVSLTGVLARIDVTAEKTGAALQRLIQGEGLQNVLALNFASAKNPGGGFIGGAVAREEDLARCSSLVACQLTQREYYDANRALSSMLYTDHIIYSPDVPFFRDERLDLLERPFLASVITAPAPNAGQALLRDPLAGEQIWETLLRRGRRVLEVAAAHGHRTLVLGAWGCGVFRNDPYRVATAFQAALASLDGQFDRIVFAVYERHGDGPNLQAFQKRFGARPTPTDG